MELQTLYLASFRKASMKKKSFEQKTPKFFIVYSPLSREPAFQASALALKPTSRLSTKSSFVGLTCSSGYINFGTSFKPSWLIKILIRLALVEWGWVFQSCRNQMPKPRKSGQRSWRMAGRNSIKCYTTRGYRLFLKSFKPSSSIGTTTILCLATLVLIKQENLSAGNIIGRASERMWRPISKAATSIWLQKRYDTNHTVISNCCQYRPTNERTFQWTLWQGYQF